MQTDFIHESRMMRKSGVSHERPPYLNRMSLTSFAFLRHLEASKQPALLRLPQRVLEEEERGN
jgi:hypothetical protein